MNDIKENEHIIKFKYDSGIYSLKYVFILVELGTITKEQFHYITTYDYDGVKEVRGW